MRTASFVSANRTAFVVIAVLWAGVGSGRAQQWVTLSGDPATWNGAYDVRRHRFVDCSGCVDGTHEWSGAAWRVVPTGAPPYAAPVARTSFGAASDPSRGLTYMFGGRVISTFADFWRYDGLAWQQIATAGGPPPRVHAVMVHDSIRDRIVLFGGESTANAILRDTWEYDGLSWLRVADAPSGVLNSCGAFDAARAQTVVLGLATLAWNGTQWSQPAQDGTTPVACMTYDSVRQRIVSYRVAGVPELREWNGSTWTTVASSGLPSLTQATMWFEPSAAKTVIASTSLDGAHLEWDGTTFQLKHNYPQVNSAAFFHDPVRGNSVVFGGVRGTNRNDTWTFDGMDWTLRAPATRPSPRNGALATFDTVRGVGLVFGGLSSSGPLSDLWSWDGSNWTLLAAAGPAGLQLASMAFDPARGRVVLAGGVDGQSINRTTWEWDGAAWRVAAVGSPFFVNSPMAFVPQRQRTVAFLGYLASPQTWEWDGATWTPVVTATVPPTDAREAAVFDATRGRVALVGMTTGFGLWEYDGVDWARRSGIDGLVFASVPTMSVDGSGRLLVYDGRSLRRLQGTLPAIEFVGTACGSPPAVLMARAAPRVGSQQFGLDLAAVPGAIAALGLAAAQTNVPLGNACTLWLGPVLDARLALADGVGWSRFDLPVPASPTLLGVTAYAQGGAIDASGGLVVSQGLRIVIGE
jgi:hypothetical protein